MLEDTTMRRYTIGLLITLALGIFLAPLAADAQTPAKMRTIGFLVPVSPATATRNLEAFRQDLHELGHVEGHNMTLEYRWAEQRTKPEPGTNWRTGTVQPPL
jgi:putative ABC transport system substrate-binding protein